MKIKKIFAYEILDSRGNPTLRTKVILENGQEGIASVPSGASTGIHEALELRDGDPQRYNGKGVLKACANVNKILALKLKGMDVFNQKAIDQKMIEIDGTENKSKLGANAILSVSLACARAGAAASSLPLYRYLRKIFGLPWKKFVLPYPTMNILNGGKHANWAADIQEFMIIPQQNKFSERLRCGAEVFHSLGKILQEKEGVIGVGDEGGYAPKLKKNQEAFELILKAIKKAGYQPGKDVYLGIDAAASELYNPRLKQYELKVDQEKRKAQDLAQKYFTWLKKYPIVLLEDPFAEDDWSAWSKFKKEALSRKPNLIIVGDDLFVTNVLRLKKGIELDAANAILIKVNQIGTLTETMAAIELAQKNNFQVVISHRSGETADTTIADLAVAVNAQFIKTGSLSRSERIEKYNRLLEIEQEI